MEALKQLQRLLFACVFALAGVALLVAPWYAYYGFTRVSAGIAAQAVVTGKDSYRYRSATGARTMQTRYVVEFAYRTEDGLEVAQSYTTALEEWQRTRVGDRFDLRYARDAPEEYCVDCSAPPLWQLLLAGLVCALLATVPFALARRLVAQLREASGAPGAAADAAQQGRSGLLVMKAIMLLFGCACLAAAAMFFIGPLRMLLDEFGMATGVESHALVTDKQVVTGARKSSGSSERERHYAVVIEFTATNGEKISGRIDTDPASWEGIDLGGRVDVIYDLDDPSRYRAPGLDRQPSLLLNVLLFLAFQIGTLLFGAIGLLLLFGAWKGK